ncbi:MAG: nitrous oxide reductase family maturation protein NosD [Promethearchaeota archaeon]
MRKIVFSLMIISLIFSSTWFMLSMSYVKSSTRSKLIFISDPIDPPIEISSDNDFLLYNFPGLGTEEDPYRLENLNIITSHSYGIIVQNITKCILIQNNKITTSYRCIGIFHTSPGTVIIANNTCIGPEFELYQLGIFVGDSPYIKILNNTCSNFYNGIDINDSPHSLIENNVFSKNHAGIRIENRVHYSKIISNLIVNNLDGMYITNSREILFENNIVRNNVVGLLLDSTNDEYPSQNCVIRNNLFENNTSFALVFSGFMGQDFTHENLVYHNSFVNNNPKGDSQAKDGGNNNRWYNESLKEGNYWSDWGGLLPYDIDGSTNAIDMYPLETPLHSTLTKIPIFFIGRIILVLLGIGIEAILVICILIFERFKKKRRNLIESINPNRA